SPNTGADNTSGFSALPGGYRDDDGSFGSIRNNAFFWSATEIVNGNAWARSLSNNLGIVSRFSHKDKSVGASVRCLRD
ncbi:MAG: fibrobacter succinogenes major paralogous domain-containing protein, partial [Saprospiraceae bacterium]|nr:fibrobacter succinogenes major paralogous domain-containing protein [Saprospiraceae bacterium]